VLRSLGGDRYDAFIDALGRRLASGRSVAQEVAVDRNPSEEK